MFDLTRSVLNAAFLTIHSWLIRRYDLKLSFDRYMQLQEHSKAKLALFKH